MVTYTEESGENSDVLEIKGRTLHDRGSFIRDTENESVTYVIHILDYTQSSAATINCDNIVLGYIIYYDSDIFHTNT